jgi:hypothetical protein
MVTKVLHFNRGGLRSITHAFTYRRDRDNQITIMNTKQHRRPAVCLRTMESMVWLARSHHTRTGTG